MHKQGCPAYNNPYAHCNCAAMEIREHTEQLRQFNENMRNYHPNLDGPAEPIGLAMAKSEHPLSLEEALRQADEAENGAMTWDAAKVLAAEVRRLQKLS